MLRRSIALCGVLLLLGCSTGDERSDPAGSATASASPTGTFVSLPPVAGPRLQRPFEAIRMYGVRPGSADDFLIQDLFVVADAQRAHIAVTGRVGALEDLQRSRGYRLRGKVELVRGLGGPARFCLRAYESDESARQWFFDTDHVLPPGESC